MGNEFKLKFTFDSHQKVEELIQSLPQFDRQLVIEGRKIYEFRMTNKDSSMPNLSIEIRNGELFLCDYGDGHEILNELLIKINERYGDSHLESE